MQQLFNAADTSVAGYFGNPNALAAVGTNAENVALIVTLSFGLSVGANIIIANRIEKNERRSVPAVTETVVILALIIDVIGFFIGQAATTFTGQNSAAGKRERGKKKSLACLLHSVISSLFAIVPVVVFKEFFAGLFSKDGAAIGFACMRIMCILLFEPICSLYEIPAGVLRGTGYAVLPALSTVLGTCVFRIVWIFTVFNTHKSLETLYLAFPLSRVLTIISVLLSFLFVRIRASSE